MDNLESLLVNGRECGDCTVCCVSLRIENDQLQKLAGSPCVHLCDTGGCSIYDVRPDVCRSWYCGWRILPGLPDELRPDRSGLLFRIDNLGDSRIILEALRDYEAVLAKPPVIDFVRQLMSSGVTVLISVPTKPGHENTLVELTSEAMSDPAVGLETMRRAVRTASQATTYKIRPLLAPSAIPEGVRRASQCPCGSGERFKNCHGAIRG
jgi:hypothetical protein